MNQSREGLKPGGQGCKSSRSKTPNLRSLRRKNASITEGTTRGSGRYKGPMSPLTVELDEVPWLPRFDPAILPQFDGESDLREFLQKYEVAIESGGGGQAMKAKGLVMALKGLAQRWYTNLPNGHIHSVETAQVKTVNKFLSHKMQ